LWAGNSEKGSAGDAKGLRELGVVITGGGLPSNNGERAKPSAVPVPRVYVATAASTSSGGEDRSEKWIFVDGKWVKVISKADSESAPGCNANTHFRRGGAHLAPKHYADVVTAVGKAIAARPDHAEAYVMMGIASERLKKYPQAIAAYRKYIALKPKGGFAAGVRERIAVLSRKDPATKPSATTAPRRPATRDAATQQAETSDNSARERWFFTGDQWVKMSPDEFKRHCADVIAACRKSSTFVFVVNKPLRRCLIAGVKLMVW